MAIKIAALCVAAAVICVAIRVNRPEIAMATGLAAGLVACLMATDELGAIVSLVRDMASGAGLGDADSALLLRACGLALIGEYASALCRDAGESALSQRVEFAMRISLLALAAPLASRVLGAVSALAP